MKLKGKTVGAVGVFRDITEEKEIDRSKTEFVSIVSHQLRTPLGITKWYLEAVKDDIYSKNAPRIINNYLNEIYKNNERLISLVRNLLSVSRIDQKQIKDNPQLTDMIKLIKTIIKEISVGGMEKNIKINLIVKQPKIPAMMIDPFRFREVIGNLIMNAIEYSLSPGSVEVTVNKKTDNMLLISIKDTGIGLSEKDQKKLFTKFFRSDKAVSKNPDGSGLGLYVVKSYVKAWGGEVFVASREGKGSTFTITIPLKPSEAIVNAGRKKVSKR